MKIYIGPYIDWFGPYQLAYLLQKVGVSESRTHEIGRYLSKTWVGTFLEWVHSKKKRDTMVIIDNYDIWNANNTLAMVILPVLKKLRDDKTGTPWVDDEDAPWYYAGKFSTPREDADFSGWDDNCEYRWNYVIDEMIWAFEQLVNDDWEDRYHHGHIDIAWLDTDNPKLKEMGVGPKNTHWWDKDGYMNHQNKIQNGLRLFGKYYQTLWT